MKFQFAVLLLLAGATNGQQKMIALYPAKASGSENWNWQQKVSDTNGFNTKIIYNVVEPSLMLFPAKGIATGTVIIIAPGGGLFALS